MMRGYDDMKKIMLVVTTVVLLAIFVYEGSLAFFHAQTDISANISAGNLGIELVQDMDKEKITKTENGFQIRSSMSGDEIKDRVYVENKRDHSLYTRVAVTKYWVNKDNEKMVDADASKLKLITEDTSKWIIIDDADNSNSEIVYFYYKLPLEKGGKTTNLVDAIKISHEIKNGEYADYRIHIAYDADAIQSIAGAEAALSEWGVELSVDEEGSITSVVD